MRASDRELYRETDQTDFPPCQDQHLTTTGLPPASQTPEVGCGNNLTVLRWEGEWDVQSVVIVCVQLPVPLAVVVIIVPFGDTEEGAEGIGNDGTGTNKKSAAALEPETENGPWTTATQTEMESWMAGRSLLVD